MKVHELIAKLQTMPQDADVVYALYSDYSEMEAEDVQYVSADEKRIAKRRGEIVRCDPRWVPPNESVEWVSVVCFPGN